MKLDNIFVLATNLELTQVDIVLGLAIYWLGVMSMFYILRFLWNMHIKSKKENIYFINVALSFIIIFVMILAYAWLFYVFISINLYLMSGFIVLSVILSLIINKKTAKVADMIFSNSFMETYIKLRKIDHKEIMISRFILVFNQLGYTFVFLTNLIILLLQD
ncbi:MAG: hypothetical protein KJ971_03230 [Firmicutes bacterium]|nr:hypothetical protein [Bacillota bacterium]